MMKARKRARRETQSMEDPPAPSERNFGGRPGREPQAGERVHLGIRVTPEMKRRLEEASAGNGRSQSQEAEFRLERSFDRTGLLPEVLTLAFDKETAGIVLMLANVMHVIGMIAGDAEKVASWSSGPDTFDHVAKGVVRILDACRPSDPPGQIKLNNKFIADAMIRAVRGDPPDKAIWNFTPNGDTIRELLGPVADRLKEPKP